MALTQKILLSFSLIITTVSELSAQSIVGAWYIENAGESKSDAVITFLTDGTYTMGEDGDSRADPSGKTGMERGTYRWNSATSAFSSRTLVDTTGEWGLSNSAFKSAKVTATKLTLTADDGSFTLTRAASRRPGIVGSWFLKENGGYAVATFLSNGTYFMVQDGPRQRGGKSGVEVGTYQWNKQTKSFTRKIVRDTNGSWGFSDSGKLSVTVSGNQMTLKGDGTFKLSRVVAR